MAGEDRRITVILSSPRPKSNSSALAAEIARGAASAGGRVETFDLRRLKVGPCIACYHCKKKKGCSVDDDMQKIYPSLAESGVWVVASPVYWFSLSAQLKCFIDRLFCLYSQDPGRSLMRGKKIAAAFSYGCEDPFESGCNNAIRMIQDMARYTGCDFAGYVHGSGEMKRQADPAVDGYLKPGVIPADSVLMQQAYRLGIALMD
ncbi:flavodoxin family protein [Desulforhopalus singaporensis]|uniref:Multimeric flavodoxin WrbA n=1 Tax=Desulforhopalus singaporensis TaxID=91360 RepID=A0A1H0KFA2_9BACT|nr:flavodoxin family protein [Desulforhopalus singaporensis]SDO54607.1 Multimeric flavodoxin WrbA [Desulforhopalus singaporensis]